MKKLLIAATALSAIVATPAFANAGGIPNGGVGNGGGSGSTTTETAQFNLTANNPAKCNLEATNYTFTLQNDSLTDANGVALGTVGNTVAAALNGAGVTAWCTGATNKLQMYRSAFVAGNGNQLPSGFNQALIYDVAMNIANATRTDGTSPLEGTSDGKGNGPGLGVGGGLSVSRFGPTGNGSTVSFLQEAGQTSKAVTTGTGEGATSSFTGSNARLVAGSYTSTLTIELTPGV